MKVQIKLHEPYTEGNIFNIIDVCKLRMVNINYAFLNGIIIGYCDGLDINSHLQIKSIETLD